MLGPLCVPEATRLGLGHLLNDFNIDQAGQGISGIRTGYGKAQCRQKAWLTEEQGGHGGNEVGEAKSGEEVRAEWGA